MHRVFPGPGKIGKIIMRLEPFAPCGRKSGRRSHYCNKRQLLNRGFELVGKGKGGHKKKIEADWAPTSCLALHLRPFVANIGEAKSSIHVFAETTVVSILRSVAPPRLCKEANLTIICLWKQHVTWDRGKNHHLNGSPFDLFQALL